MITWVLLPSIIALVLCVRQLPEPAHQIVDAGVSAGIGLGTLSVLYYFLRTLVTKQLPEDVDQARVDRQSKNLGEIDRTGLLQTDAASDV